MSASPLEYDDQSADFGLTSMELNCLRRAAHGIRPLEIGAQLNISERETEILLYCAERKLGARNRLHAVGIAVARGLIGIDI